MSNAILFLLFFLLSCGKVPQKDPRRFKSISAVFTPYVELYEREKGSAVQNIAMGFLDLPGAQVGLCVEYSTGEKEIYIDKNFWYNESSEQQKLATVLHEFGHCDLGRKHDLRKDEAGRPISIMFPELITWSENEEESYFRELFGN